MAMIETTRTAPFGAETIYKGANLVEDMLNEVRARVHAYRIHTELSALSHKQLTDIGLGEKDLGSYSLEIARRAL